MAKPIKPIKPMPRSKGIGGPGPKMPRGKGVGGGQPYKKPKRGA